MDLSTIKQVICNAIPSNVNVSDIDIKEGNGKITIELTWEVLKASESGKVFDTSKWKVTSLPPLPIGLTPESYWKKLRDDFDNSHNEMRAFKEARFEAEQELLPLCRKLIADHPEKVKRYRAGENGQVDFLVNKFLTSPNIRTFNSKTIEHFWDVELIREVLGRILNEDPIKDLAAKVISSEPLKKSTANEQYEKTLIRTGIDKSTAARIASNTPYCKEDQKDIGPKKTAEGKLVTPIDLKHKNYSFRRVVFDGYQPLPIDKLAEAQKINDLLSKKKIEKEDIDSLINKGFSLEAINFFKERYMFPGNKPGCGPQSMANDPIDVFANKCKIYQENFGGNVITDKVGATSVVDDKSNHITDTEVMFYTNKKAIDSIINELKPLVESEENNKPVEKEEYVKKEIPLEPPPPVSRFNRILSHLKAIKAEVYCLIGK